MREICFVLFLTTYSIQLMNDGEHWWVINIYWMQESQENPIPDEYLPKN